jgi:predicted DNA-binding transcriptional regulator YafY
MSTNKHAQIRYQALDRCFSNFGRRYFIDDLVEACNKALLEYKGIPEGVKKRQVQDDIVYMESDAGWSIPLARHKEGQRVYYRYENSRFSINQLPLNQSDIDKLGEMIAMLNRFKGMPQFRWMEELLARLEETFKLRGREATNVVGFESNPYLRGLDYFSDVFNAIINRQSLRITYQRFRKEPSAMTFHPYFLKQYNNRWFLLGMCDHLKERKLITNLALDRIERVEAGNVPYIFNRDIDFDEYFEDVVGVTVNDSPLEHVVVEVDNDLLPYVETKPLHGSQKIKMRGAHSTMVSLDVIVNHELENLLLCYIDKIRIVSPQLFRERMLERIKEAMAKNI